MDTEPDQSVAFKHWFMRDVPYSWDTLVENVVSGWCMFGRGRTRAFVCVCARTRGYAQVCM